MHKAGKEAVMAAGLFDVSVDGGVLLAVIDRPERRNAYSYDLERALHDALVGAAADPSVRAVVLTASGASFCPGFDPDAIAGVAAGGSVDTAIRSTLPFHMATRDKPVICAINGGCAGIGLALALTCDLRLAAAGSRFATAFGRLRPPAERGTSRLLPRLVGHGRAARLLFTGRTFDAAEAHELGLVHEVVPGEELRAHAFDVADRIAATVSPASLVAMKRQPYRDWTASLDDAVSDADRRLGALVSGPDLRGAVAARAEGRPPRFTPPVRQEIR